MRQALRSIPRVLSRLVPLLASAAALAALGGCATYRDQLVRSQHSFEQNRHEQTLGLLRTLEADVTKLSTPEQAQYAYLRGMTDYRIGHRSDARHWLAIARTYDETTPGILPADWKARMVEALDELNGVVYTDGLAELAKPKATPDTGK
jgi:hypothetical protein